MIFYSLGLCYKELNDYKKAMAYFENALKNFKDNSSFLISIRVIDGRFNR